MNKFRFNINSEDRFINIPIQINTDLLGKEDLIEKYEDDVVEKVINPIEDFEITRYNHNRWYNIDNEEKYSIEYKFNFFNRSTDIESTTPANINLWVNDYNFSDNLLYSGIDFSDGEIYYNVNSFKRSFFKIDFYDTLNSETQQIYLTIILPTEQGKTRLSRLEPTPTPTPSEPFSLCNEHSVTNITNSNVNFTYLGCDGNSGTILIGPGDTEILCFINYSINGNSGVSVNVLGNCTNPLSNHNTQTGFLTSFSDCDGNGFSGNVYMDSELYNSWYSGVQNQTFSKNLFGTCYNLDYVSTNPQTISFGPFNSETFIENQTDLNPYQCDCPEPTPQPTPSLSSSQSVLPCNEYSIYNPTNNIIQINYYDCDSVLQNAYINPNSTLILCFTSVAAPYNQDLVITLIDSCDTPAPSGTQIPTPTNTPTPSITPLPPGSGGTVNPNPPGIGQPNQPSTINAPENSQIKLPNFFLDYIGDKQGYFLYWLKNPSEIKPDVLYMTSKFFNAKTGQFIRMTNQPQAMIPNKFNFDKSVYFYYKVTLDYENYTYEVYDINTNLRVGTDTPINWYEYVNPQ